MKIKIHYEVDGHEDSYVLSGTLNDIKGENEKEMLRRNIEADKNKCWSEVTER